MFLPSPFTFLPALLPMRRRKGVGGVLVFYIYVNIRLYIFSEEYIRMLFLLILYFNRLSVFLCIFPSVCFVYK